MKVKVGKLTLDSTKYLEEILILYKAYHYCLIIPKDERISCQITEHNYGITLLKDLLISLSKYDDSDKQNIVLAYLNIHASTPSNFIRQRSIDNYVGMYNNDVEAGSMYLNEAIDDFHINSTAITTEICEMISKAKFESYKNYYFYK